MSQPGAPQKPYSAEEFLSAGNLERADEAVEEIFRMMFGFDIHPIADLDSNASVIGPDDRTAVVGFSGAMRGSCHVRISSAAARAIVSAMLGGISLEDDDDSLDDALGELCNMLAGGWKNAIPELSFACTLSPPTVISGHDYKVHIRKPSVKLRRTYTFDVYTLHLTLSCEETENRKACALACARSSPTEVRCACADNSNAESRDPEA